MDYSERLKVWRENLRLWVITLDHDRYESRVQDIEASHRRSQNINLKVCSKHMVHEPHALRPVPIPGAGKLETPEAREISRSRVSAHAVSEICHL